MPKLPHLCQNCIGDQLDFRCNSRCWFPPLKLYMDCMFRELFSSSCLLIQQDLVGRPHPWRAIGLFLQVSPSFGTVLYLGYLNTKPICCSGKSLSPVLESLWIYIIRCASSLQQAIVMAMTVCLGALMASNIDGYWINVFLWFFLYNFV